VAVRNQCVHRIYDPLGRGFTVCGRESNIRGRHGFLCESHQLRSRRPAAVSTQSNPIVEVNCEDIVRRDWAAIALGSGKRVGDRFNLMRASIYKSDGTPKFGWRGGRL